MKEQAMTIEILESREYRGQWYEKGEVRVVADAVGKFFCKQGWARDATDRNLQTPAKTIYTR